MRGRTRTLASKVKVVLITIFVIYLFVQVFTSTKLFSNPSSADTALPKPRPKDFAMGAHKLHLSKSKTHRMVPVFNQSARPRSNVIINSYMRAGSSFFGRLLGYHPDSFYIYEPLWKFSIWDYYKTERRMCDSRTCQCRHISSTNVMVDRLRAMVSCTGLNEVVVAKMTAFYSGIPWMNFTKCIKDNSLLPKNADVGNDVKIPPVCIDEMKTECHRHTHVISKVLRLTVDMYRTFLDKNHDTKVIHLFRDPRAVLNSRLKTKWYPVETLQDVDLNAKCLCQRMLQDYEAGLSLQDLYPGRFKMVFYEDLTSNLHNKTDKLYRFARIRSIGSIGEEIFQSIARFGYKSDHSKRDNSTDFSSWWRRSLDWTMLQSIDIRCHKVYKAIGYQKFDSEEELRDMTIPSLILPFEHTL